MFADQTEFGQASIHDNGVTIADVLNADPAFGDRLLCRCRYHRARLAASESETIRWNGVVGLLFVRRGPAQLAEDRNSVPRTPLPGLASALLPPIVLHRALGVRRVA